MNIGEILVRFGAETSGFSGGVSMLIGLLGKFGASLALIGKSMSLMDMSRYLSSIGATNTAMQASSQASAAMSAGLKGVGVAALAAVAALVIIGAVAAVAIGVISVKAAADFQQGMNRLATGAGNVTDNMKTLGQGILSVSIATGTLTSGTNGLLAAMYLIDSSGQRGAQSLDTLKAAAQGAKIEQANLADVTQILTTLQTDFGLHTYTATQYMNGLVAAVSHGKITLEALSTAMSPILPNAKELGIHFADVAAAMSDMTNQGIPADQAATSLRFVMQSMILPTHASAAAMKQWGLDTGKVASEMKVSLPGAIQMYIDAAKRAGPEGSQPFIDALAGMMGGGQRAAKALFSLSQSMGTWKSDIAAVNTALGQNSRDVMGWETVQGSFNIKLGQAHAALDALFIVIGTRLLPVLTQIVGQITPIIQKFADWVTHTHDIDNAIKAVTPYFNAMFDIIKAALPVVIGLFLKFVHILGQVITWIGQNKAVLEALMTIMKALGIIIVGVVAAGLLFLAVAFVALGVVIFGIIGVVMTLISIWKMLVAAAGWVSGAWHSVIGWLGGAWHSLVAIATSAFNGMKNAIVSAVNATVSWITSAFNGVITWLVNAWHSCVQAVVAAFAWLYNHNYYFKQLIDTIRNVVSGGIAWLTTAWANSVKWIGEKWALLKGLAQSAWDLVVGVFNSVWGTISGILSSLWASISGWWTGTAIPQMKSKATSAWQGVSQVFSSAWGTYISGPLNSLGGLINGFFSNLAGQMVQLGRNLIQGLVDGINSMLGVVSGAASNVASTITSILGFHSPPPQGPAADADTWMPNMVNLLAKGMTAGVPSVTRAAVQLAQPIQGNLSASGTRSATPGSSSSTRPIIVQFGNAEYRGLIQNLGHDLQGTIVIQKGGLR